MIDYTELRGLVEGYIGKEFRTLPVIYENTFTGPEEEHVEISLDDVSGSTEAIGSSKYFVTGLLIVEIYTKKGNGTQKAREVASELSALIYPDCIPGVYFEEKIFNSVGPIAETNLYKHILTVSYSYLYGDQTTIC